MSGPRILPRGLGLIGAATALFLACGGSAEHGPSSESSGGAVGGMTMDGAGGRDASLGGSAGGELLGGSGGAFGGSTSSVAGSAGGLLGGTGGVGLAQGGASGAWIGSGGCYPTPTLPEQDPRCPRGLVTDVSWRCSDEGLKCVLLEPTGGASKCMQPPILVPGTCCNGMWGTVTCDGPGGGGAGGAAGGGSVNGCWDKGWGFSSDGTLHDSRGPDDTLILTAQEPGPPVPSGSACAILDHWRCHLLGRIIGAADPAATPAGSGGAIVPGAYALVRLTAFGGADSGLLVGTRTQQTLYFSDSSAVFQSDDDHRFAFTGAYRYSTEDTKLILEPTCESQDPLYRQWSLEVTFTATESTLELYSSTLNYGATYALVP